MIKIKHTEVLGWEHAIRGMRNPKNSWDKSDTGWVADLLDGEIVESIDYDFDSLQAKIIGANDLKLMKQLVSAGSDHRKFMRMISVYADITAPRYWWTEYDTYKVGTVANSCSTMHKIHSRPLTLFDFSAEQLDSDAKEVLLCVIETLNTYREYFCENNSKADWYTMIQLLPQSYNQKRTVMLNYEVLRNMYHARKNHKLDEWREFCKWIESLPYSELITG